MSRFQLPQSHYKKFFTLLRKATLALGLTGDDADNYYRKTLTQICGVSSIKKIPSMEAYDDCLRRFALDAGDYSRPLDFATDKQKRYAYVIKVMTLQIMQLARLDESNARAYFDGIVRQSTRDSAGCVSAGNSFYLDFEPRKLLLFIRILDTHLRRLKKQHFPLFPLSFDDRVRYVAQGSLFLREEVDKYYYANQNFTTFSVC